MENHYTTLGVAENASDEQIHQAYRNLVRINRADAEKIKIINTAYNILKRPEKRRDHDAQLAKARSSSHNTSQNNRSGQSSAPPPPPPPPPPPLRSVPISRSNTSSWKRNLLAAFIVGTILVFSGALYFVFNFLIEKKNSTSENQAVTTAEPLNSATDRDHADQNEPLTNDCNSYQYWVKLAGRCYQVELALNPISRALGLGGRSNMPATYGMLYVYEQPHIGDHITKGMLFPMDILFFDKKNRLINQYHNASPCTYDYDDCPSYDSKKPALYALELNAEQAAQLNLKMSDELILGPSILQEIALLELRKN